MLSFYSPNATTTCVYHGNFLRYGMALYFKSITTYLPTYIDKKNFLRRVDSAQLKIESKIMPPFI